jgi:hypothetical protein
LNNIGADNIIRTGQQLIIRGPTAPPTNTPPPVPPTPEASPTSVTGSICALVFNDRNADTFRQVESEELVPNATLSLGDATSLISQHTTDGLTEPYCFTGLAGGSYRVVVQPPPGYIASGSDQIALILGAGGQLDMVFGVQRGEGAATPTSPANNGGGGGESGGGGGGSMMTVLRWGALISGIVILLLAVVVAVVFILSRQR